MAKMSLFIVPPQLATFNLKSLGDPGFVFRKVAHTSRDYDMIPQGAGPVLDTSPGRLGIALARRFLVIA